MESKTRAKPGAKARAKTGRVASQATPAPVDLDILPELLTFNLRRIQAKLRRAISGKVGRSEKGAGLFSVLVLAGANPGIGQNHLARHCDLDEVSVVALLDRMEKFGWVERRRSQQDRRRQGVFLMPPGAAKLRQLTRIAQDNEARFLSQLSVAEQRQLFDLLQRLQ